MISTYKINFFVLYSSDIYFPAGTSYSLIDITLKQGSLPKTKPVEQVVMIAIVIRIKFGSPL